MAHEKSTAAYAIIETGGKQFKVRRDRRIRVPALAGQAGDRVTFDRVLYSSDGDRAAVGAPTVQGATVMGEIVGHGKDRKVVVFKVKRRHRYRRKTGHRQAYTEVAILDLALGDAGSLPAPAEPQHAALHERGDGVGRIDAPVPGDPQTGIDAQDAHATR